MLVKGSYILGAQVSEIPRLKWGDIEWLSNGGQVHLLGKGSKALVVLVSRETVELFEPLSRGAASEFIFKGHRSGTHLTRQAIAFAIRKWGSSLIFSCIPTDCGIAMRHMQFVMVWTCSRCKASLATRPRQLSGDMSLPTPKRLIRCVSGDLLKIVRLIVLAFEVDF